MPTISELFPGKYLKAADLKGREPIVTIDRVEIEKVGSGDDAKNKPVVYFKDKDRGVVLNVTNATMIAELAGDDDIDNWGGVEIKLYMAQVEFQGKRGPAIRIAAPKAPEPVTEDEDDTVPF